MNIKMKKINVLTGTRMEKTYSSQIHSRFVESGVPTWCQEVLPLTQLYNDAYWWGLNASDKVYMAIPDHRHWYYDDDVFEAYVERVSSVEFPVFCLGEAPFSFEMPSRVDSKSFTKKLFERIGILAHRIRERHPSTVLLAPGIGIVPEKSIQMYLDFFVHNRQHFDGYAVHICNDMREHNLGKVSSLLNQVMKILPKKIWVTKWAVPCLDERVINPQVMASSGWQPYKQKDAVRRLEHSFTFFESMASAGSVWFYTGTDRDLYKPKKVPGCHELWQSQPTHVPEEYSYDWQYWHFLGLLTSDGVPKDELLEGIVRLANSN